MREDDNDMHVYSGQEIRRYLEGKLSPENMHRMEKRALSDPFLADAIAGMELHAVQHDDSSYKNDLAELNNRLQSKVRDRNGIVIMWWRVAAVLVLVAGAVVMTFFFADKKMQHPVTVAKMEVKKPVRGDTQSNASPAPVDAPEKARGAVDATDTPRDAIASMGESPSQTARAVNRRSNGKLAADEAVESLQKREKTSLAREEEKPGEADRATQPAARLPTNILQPMTSPEADSVTRQLEGKVAGISADTSSKSLNEVVVVGYGAHKKKKLPGIADAKTIRNCTPDGGWTKFESYVDAHKMDAVEDRFLHGTTTVAFSIGDNTRPEHIVIIRSLSPSHDSAIVRLLSRGPDWTPKHPMKRGVKLSIVY